MLPLLDTTSQDMQGAHMQVRAVATACETLTRRPEFMGATVDIRRAFASRGFFNGASTVSHGYLIELRRPKSLSEVFVLCYLNGQALLVVRGFAVWECRWLEVIPKINGLGEFLDKRHQEVLLK